MIITTRPVVGESGYPGRGESGYSGYSGDITMDERGYISFTEVTAETIVDSFAELALALVDSDIMQAPLVPPGGGGGHPFP
jgi:hypothetical protein